MEAKAKINIEKINDTTQKILENLSELDEMAKNKSYTIPAETELDQIRKNFDDLQLDNKDTAMKELIKWMKLRIGFYAENDADLIKGMENYHTAFSDSITMTLQNMFNDMQRYDEKLHKSLDNVNALSIKLEEFYANMHSHDSEDIKFPDLVLADKAVEGQLSTYSRETLIEQLTQMQEREKYFLEIMDSMRLNFKNVKQDLESAQAIEKNLNEKIDEANKNIAKNLENIKQLEETVSVYKAQEEMRAHALERTKIYSQEPFFVAGLEKNKTEISETVEFCVNKDIQQLTQGFTTENNYFELEYVDPSSNDNEKFALAVKEEQSKFSSQIEKLQATVEDITEENTNLKQTIEELKTKLAQCEENAIHEPSESRKSSRRPSNASSRRLSNASYSSNNGSRNEETVSGSKLAQRLSEGGTIYNSSGYISESGELLDVECRIDNLVEHHVPAINMPEDSTRSPRRNFMKQGQAANPNVTTEYENGNQAEDSIFAENDSNQIARGSTAIPGGRLNASGTFGRNGENFDGRPQTARLNSPRGNVTNDGRFEVRDIDPNDKDAITMNCRPFEAEDAREVLKQDSTPIGNENRPCTVHAGFNQKKLVKYRYGQDDMNDTQQSRTNDSTASAKYSFAKFGQKWARSPLMKNGKPLYSRFFRERMARIAAARAGFMPNAPRVKFSIVSFGAPRRRERADLLKITPLPALRTRVMGSTNPKDDNLDLSLVASAIRF